ncbi:MAG: antitoxin [Oceanospirillaceae bacterium]|nr:antitoxin [Oceanospirillaceae bacterium]
MQQGSVFKSNRSQAVRLPKSAALDEDVKKVDVAVLDRARLIAPAEESWASWFNDNHVSADFMPEREQPQGQERETL